MGMYTEVFFRARLRQATPEPVIRLLSCMGGDGPADVDLPSHPLFVGTRWMTMFQHVSSQFPQTTMSCLHLHEARHVGISAR